MAYKNVIDDSETVGDSIPGFTVNLANHTTHRLAGVGVPVRFKVCVNSTAASDTGSVRLVDASGVTMIEALVNNPAATTSSVGDWYWADGYLPATQAKYYVQRGGNSTGSLTVFSASVYEIDWTTDPITGSASMTLGALTVSADGGFRGEASMTLGALTIASDGLVETNGTASVTLGALTIAADGTVVTAAPVWQATGTDVGGAGTLSPSWPTHATDDYAILVVTTYKAFADPGAATLSVAAGFTAITGASDLTNDGTFQTRVTLFECRATSGSMTAPTVADSHDAGSAVIITFRGCTTSGSAVDGTPAVGANSTSNTSVSVPGVTTTGVNRVVLLAIGYVGGSTTGSYSNGNLTSITERLDNSAAGGQHIALATATAASSGDFGTTTATISANQTWSAVIIALKP